MYKELTRLGVLFLFTFTIFISSSYAMYHMNNEIETASIDLGVNEDVSPIMTNIVSAFQIIFGILSLGIGMVMILIIIAGQRGGGDIYERYG